MSRYKAWLKRRWQEFRWGHGFYFAYLLSLANFILITYRLLVEYMPSLKLLFPRLTTYALAVLLIYPPIAILLGHLHRKKQLKTDLVMQVEQNPVWRKLFHELDEIKRRLDQK